MLSAPRLIVASNRLPFTVQQDGADVKLQASCGGLAAALGAVHQRQQTVWIGWPGDCDGLNEAQQAQLAVWLREERVVPVTVARGEMIPYYDGVCNSVLWPVFHYLLDALPVAFPDFRMYRAINERFADAIVNEYQSGDIVWVHDYHLLLVPAMVRQRLPQAQIGFFLHTPFPAAEVFRVLPWRRELVDGLLGATLVGFQTERDANNFVDTVRALTEYQVAGATVTADDREVRVGAYPIGVDPLRLWTREGASAGGRSPQLPRTGRRLFLGVDRLDYTKGIPRRLAAFDRLLEDNPSLRGHVELLQVAVPSRSHVASYAALKQQVDALVSSINERRGTAEWTPVHYVPHPVDPSDLGDLYRAADVMLVTSVRDGMNLVAKEFVLARTDEDGVLILSELAGAAEELPEAVLINPYSVDDLADAMARALALDREERQWRMAALRRRVEAGTVEGWAERFTHDLVQTMAVRQSTSDRVESMVTAAIDGSAEVMLVLPYEGVLVPEADADEALRPDPELIALLRALDDRPGVSVHVLSGCAQELMDQWFAAAPVAVWAEHGLWRRERSGGHWRRTQWTSQRWVQDVRQLLEQFTGHTPGAFIEERGTSLIWNFQRAPRIAGRTQAQMLGALLREGAEALGFAVLETARTIEIRPAGLTLRRTLQKLIASHGSRGPLLLFDATARGAACRDLLGADDLIVGVGVTAASGGVAVETPRGVRTLLWNVASGHQTPEAAVETTGTDAYAEGDAQQVAAR